MKRVEAHLIGGLPGGPFDFLFRRGLKALEALLDEMPLIADAHYWRQEEWKKPRDGIIARHKALGPATVIFVTHSWGCYQFIKVGIDLNKHGIKIDYTGAIDPTAGPEMVVPTNVLKVDEFWATSGFPYGARRRDPTGGAGGMYRYPPGWPGKKAKPIGVNAGHVPIASHETTRKTILASVEKVLA